MLRKLMLAAAAVTMVGCSSNGAFDVGSKEEAAQSAAYASTAKVPTTAPAKSADMAAIVDGGTLKIYNFTDKTVSDAVVWINGLYVAKVGDVGPMMVKKVDFSKFYSASGTVLNTDNNPPKSVVVESGMGVHTLLGPMMQQ